MPGDVGLVAKLLDTVVGWLVSPDGYAKLTREQKLKVFHDALIEAVEKNDLAAADAVYAGLRRLSAETT